jgi:aryl-alcohol dehydrogenase-like predicted oxidoreductase
MNRRNAVKLMALAASLPQIHTHAQSENSSVKQSMLTRKIPSSGEMLPVIGLGTYQSFDVGSDAAARAPIEDVLREFAALGGKVIDSSPMYGRSEEVAGDLMAKLKLREKIFIATKVWTSGKAGGIAQMEDSMKKMKASPIDLMQVHNLLDVETHLRTLAEWKRERRVRYVGITHYTQSAYDAVMKAINANPVGTIDFLQINYAVSERDAEQRLLPLARERGIAVIVNRPFAGGELFRRLRGTALPSFASEIDCTSWAQLMLKFVISHPAVTCAIPATAKVEHLRDNMGAGLGRLPDEKMRARIVASIG